MASFQAKLGGNGRERVRVKIKVSFCSYPTRYRKIQKKKPKNSKVPLWLHFNLKQVKRPRKRENKNYRSDHFLPDPLQIIPKKIKKIPLLLHIKPKQVEKTEKERK